MKHFLRSGSRWLRQAGLALSALPMLFPPAALAAAPAADQSPPRGFILDMTPLLGENDRLRAIAPGCRAITGIIESQPFVWSRNFGMIRLPVSAPDYGMGVFLSDDGRTMTGFLSRDDRAHPVGCGQTWAQTGFIWHHRGKRHFMSRHGLVDVYWRGLSADGRVAAGEGKEPVPGAPAPDASGEELKRFARTPQGRKAAEGGYVFNRPLWFVRDGTRYSELPRFENESAIPRRVMSRDGKSLIASQSENSFVHDRKTGKKRQLTFGGFVAGGAPGEKRNIIRAGDPASPLHRWGRQRLMPNNRLLADAELAALHKKKELDPESPMLLDWFIHDIASCAPSFDARYSLCRIRLEPYRPDISPDRPLPGGFSLLARLDDKGGVTPIADDDDAAAGALGVLWDISDNGRIVLYDQKREMHVWNEDMPTPDRYDNAWTLRDYLASFGLALPPGRRVTDALMSPDGRCFFGRLDAEEEDRRFPYREFLACTGEGIEPPHWTPRNDLKTARP